MRSGHGLAAALAAAVVIVWLGLMTVSLRSAALPSAATGTVLAVARQSSATAMSGYTWPPVPPPHNTMVGCIGSLDARP